MQGRRWNSGWWTWSCLTYQMTELLQGSRTVHKQGAPSLLQTGAAATTAAAAARKGCWLQFFEFCTASCLSACLSVWSIGLLCCEADNRPGPLVSCLLYRAPWFLCGNSVLRKIFGPVKAVVRLSVECDEFCGASLWGPELHLNVWCVKQEVARWM